MIILGIDPGTTRIGYAVIEKKDSDNLNLLTCGCLESKNKEQKDRLKEISDLILDLILKYRPEVLAIEKLFFTKNAKTALAVAEARGVIINSANSLNIREFTPLEIKVAITGYGKAEKEQVKKMACRILKLEKMPKIDDTSDALAIALTACYTNPKFTIKP
ncbi:MAG: crossover junction endodeoxyribonuclease RuvC [Candidatus Nealsonbacteria bacterium CG_4_10_14_0_2_um_filter_40_15]|uniref:Crossover junction endodeoxyribonuclease RuvC n=1 Tax=Candidatus Nealsonbacteria bacterium CG_4_10_14_0_2_um_filter_40_15 TaxID=1974682 RepID=A0A2M7UUS0_9BACT|nr:MAG: crossover junction endodeoxyribonuclease RuvC [Candidatus Nealsonbacteria bacterium CG_4_10_14_0_2_um_filter_40_15]